MLVGVGVVCLCVYQPRLPDCLFLGRTVFYSEIRVCLFVCLFIFAALNLLSMKWLGRLMVVVSFSCLFGKIKDCRRQI